MENIIIQMLQKKFFLMFIPKHNVFGVRARGEELSVESTKEIEFCEEILRENKILVFETKLGSFAFVNMRTFAYDAFQILQKKNKDVLSYVFCADGDFGYFKILENGKISRKIASFGEVDGVQSYPDTRGVPCSFEKEKNKIFKIDKNEYLLEKMLKDFGRREVMELIDYYIGVQKITESTIERSYSYELEFH